MLQNCTLDFHFGVSEVKTKFSPYIYDHFVEGPQYAYAGDI